MSKDKPEKSENLFSENELKLKIIEGNNKGVVYRHTFLINNFGVIIMYLNEEDRDKLQTINRKISSNPDIRMPVSVHKKVTAICRRYIKEEKVIDQALADFIRVSQEATELDKFAKDFAERIKRKSIGNIEWIDDPKERL